jgi:phosphocarrier protein
LTEKEITVINKLGLHARPAAQLVKTISKFRSEVTIKRDNLTVNAKSIMGVMMLAAELGAVLKFRIEGEDERQAMDAIEKVFQDKFGED